MREHLKCKRCEAFEDRRLALHGLGETRKSFNAFGAQPHYAPDLPFRAKSLKLEVELDPRQKKVKGSVTHQLEVMDSSKTQVRLDQNGIEIQAASVNGRKASFSIEEGSVWIEVPTGLTKIELKIDYTVEDPKRGLYFIAPTAEKPGKRFEIWSQGQDEDNRHWIPLLDYPNQKVLTEIVAKVPKGFLAISNGALLEKKDEGNWTRFHYRLGTPHVSYLISLVVGEYAAWEDQGPRGLPVQYFVEKGREADGKRAFGNTPKMIEAFERRTGVPYPYEKYSQVAVQNFIFGGMENTSATTQTDAVLMDTKALQDFSGDPLVSHELAHQWFGDLVTCRDWSHGWLNEGFATFMERVWVEENLTEYGTREKAREEAKYYSYADWREYSAEDANFYRRPIVCNSYSEPIDLFDTHLYQKGGLVLNLLRAQLGDERFWKSIRLYLERHRGGSVETLDLIRAIEDATGKNLRRFFDQWVFCAGFPELEVTYAYHEEQKLMELVVEQKQTRGQAELVENGVKTSLFELDVPVRVRWGSSSEQTFIFAMKSVRDRMFFSVPARPTSVRLDPEFTIPKAMKFPRPKELLMEQLRNDSDCMGRIEAAQELAKIADSAIVQALSEQLERDKFWGVQAEILTVLGTLLAHESAQKALVAAAKISHPKARRVAALQLAKVSHPDAEKVLKSLAESDASYLVEARAIQSWVEVRSNPWTLDRLETVADTERQLLLWLPRESFTDWVRGAVLGALAKLPGIGRGERPKALDALLEWLRPEKNDDSRVAAISALCLVLETANPGVSERIYKALDSTASEPNFRLRMRLTSALGGSGRPEVLSILSKIHFLDSDGRVRRTARVMMDHLRESGGVPSTVSLLKSEVDRLTESQKKLESMVERLVATSGLKEKGSKSKPKPKPKKAKKRR